VGIRQDVTGQKFGRLVALRAFTEKRKDQVRTKWICRCECGNETTVESSNLKKGGTRSCGCLGRVFWPERPDDNRNIIDLVGQHFGKLQVIQQTQSNPVKWLCRCECGNEITVRGKELRAGGTRSCGCLRNENARKRVIDLTGLRFGQLFVLGEAERKPNKGIKWLCRCECGNERAILGSHLRNGHTRSCGCLAVDVKKGNYFPTRHGHSRNSGMSAEYRTWTSMRQRCNNPCHPGYEDYGGRGIKVCERGINMTISSLTWACVRLGILSSALM
jgi:hypothetical protein